MYKTLLLVFAALAVASAQYLASPYSGLYRSGYAAGYPTAYSAGYPAAYSAYNSYGAYPAYSAYGSYPNYAYSGLGYGSAAYLYK